MEPHENRLREPERNSGIAHRMSGNSYGYYYPQTNATYPEKQWSEWIVEQQQYNNSTNYQRSTFNETVAPNHANHPGSHVPQRPYYPYSPQNNTRPFHNPRRYNTTNHQYGATGPPSWNRNSNNYKRPRLDSEEPSEPKSKTSKKKKKPLSQNVPSKKDWTLQEAEMALTCEKEYNKRHKNQSLIIKFPDLELNKDIVSNFHSSIENVHFQQPSTARFCFVTLEESADATTVISALNKIKFGEGHLIAEYKKDREDDQNIGPEDIDPHTLYVGNLAQEITKEDMVKAYPKCKRIDIGYAKKMKYTRYAFVTFKSVADSVEAFKKTHSTQMYSKSLIVRFRRLHGTVGMPGESKPQNPPKTKENSPPPAEETVTLSAEQSTSEVKCKDPDEDMNLSVVKKEPQSDGEGEALEDDSLKITGEDDMIIHKPFIKDEVKDELFDDELECKLLSEPAELKDILVKDENDVKDEDDIKEEDDDDADVPFPDSLLDSSGDDDNENEDGFDTNINFSKMYANMMTHANNISSLSKTNP